MPRETHGERRRRQIVETAADLSTAEGLESLSLSRLATEVGLSKPGVAAHFGSKEALQLAVVDAAAGTYTGFLAEVQERSLPGLSRLRALGRAWLDHLEGIDYRGGCFFAAAGHDFSGRPGAVRDAIARATRRFVRILEEQARLAERLGELRPGADADALAFSLHAVAQEANLRRELLDDPEAFALARRALDQLLEAAIPPPTQESSP
jgi:AcrR family transcriptional regulator